MGYYDIGDLVSISGAFTNADGDYVDPTEVYCAYTDPSGNTTTLHYGVDPEVVKDAVGRYHVDVDVDEEGRWPFRWWSTGTGQAAGTSRLVVTHDAE